MPGRVAPNPQDATGVIHNMEWVLAELVRLHHSVSSARAQSIIADLVSKDVPLIPAAPRPNSPPSRTGSSSSWWRLLLGQEMHRGRTWSPATTSVPVLRDPHLRTLALTQRIGPDDHRWSQPLPEW